MMWLKRNLPLFVAALIFCFFVVLSLYLLKGAEQRKGEIQIKHRELDDKLKSLVSKNPFPSEGNAKELNRQAVELNDYYTAIFSSLPKKKVEYTRMEPLMFKGYLETRINAIRQECDKNNVVISPNASFGFGKYVMSNSRPKEEETDKLQHQLDILETLVKLLTVAGVKEISSVRRTPVEGESLGTEDRVEGASWNRDPKLIYESQSVDLTFRCSDEVLKSTLNRIANSSSYVLLVRTIRVESEQASPSESVGSAGVPAARDAGAGAPMPPMRDPRPGAVPRARPPVAQVAPKQVVSGEPVVVMGNELATVNLRLDVIELKLPEEKNDSKPDPAKQTPEKKS